MLESVKVQGFRSLKDFHLEIRPGLNVLVGPNGAGKTNIILFFEFLKSVGDNSINDAVGAAGGVAQVFSKRGKERFSETLSSVITGSVVSNGEVYEYKYSFAIQFSATRQEVSFSRQSIEIKKRSFANSYDIYLKAETATNYGEPENFSIERSEDARGESQWMDGEFERFKKVRMFSQRSLISIVQYTGEVCAQVSRDLSGRFVLNVVPSQVKKLEDSTRQPFIDIDGSGLSATLYAIKKKKPFYERYVYAMEPPEAINPQWQNVIDLIRVAVPSIEDIEVVNDPFDNLLRCRVTIGKGSKRAVLPLSAMSDGTVKWMSLVVRLSTSRAALLLEEPENYLHPLMQREIVSLLRNSVSERGFMLVSTHSETLLNAVKAEELIVVQYRNGGTRANRVKNAKNVEREINATGFGLGYYYLADAIEA